MKKLHTQWKTALIIIACTFIKTKYFAKLKKNYKEQIDLINDNVTVNDKLLSLCCQLV